MAESRETYAYFWVAADKLPHTEISSALDLEPTKRWDKGDRGRYAPKLKQACWEYHSSPLRDENIDSHISALLEVLYPKADVIAELSKKYEIGIQCVGYYIEANPGFHMTRDILAKVASLNVELDFDLYCYCTHDKDNSAK